MSVKARQTDGVREDAVMWAGRRSAGQANIGRASVAILLFGLILVTAGCGGGRGSTVTSGRFVGEVQNEQGAPLEATVYVNGVTYSTVGGVFQTNSLPYGLYEITVVAAGYQSQTTSVNLRTPVYRLTPPFTFSGEPDYTAPTVTAFSPAGQTGVFRDTKLVFTFSEAMNQNSVEAAVRITPAVGLTFAWDDATHLVVTQAGLAGDTFYTVTVGTGAKDRAGNALAVPYSRSFRTGTGNTPDTRIAFVQQLSDEPPLLKLYLIPDAPGSEPIPLLGDPVEDFEPSWSADGRRLVFSSRRGGDGSQVHLYVSSVDAPYPVPVLDPAPPELGNESMDSRPHWSPVDNRIAFTSGPRGGPADLWVVAVDEQGKATGSPVKVTALSTGPTDIESPEWSPDGTMLVFSSIHEDQTNRRLYAVDVSTGQLSGTLTPGVLADCPTWWSNGTVQKIAFSSRPTATDKWDLWVMEVQVSTDGGGRRVTPVPGTLTQLTSTPTVAETNPVWSPDGQSLVFIRDDGVTTKRLYKMSVPAAGDPVEMTTGTLSQDTPAWSRQ